MFTERHLRTIYKALTTQNNACERYILINRTNEDVVSACKQIIKDNGEVLRILDKHFYGEGIPIDKY